MINGYLQWLQWLQGYVVRWAELEDGDLSQLPRNRDAVLPPFHAAQVSAI